MKLKLNELFTQAQESTEKKLTRTLLNEYAPAGITSVEQLNDYLTGMEGTAEAIKSLMTSHVNPDAYRVAQRRGVTTSSGKRILESWERGDDRLPIKVSEALHANDANIMFKRVISDVLMMPRETTYIGQSLLARTVRVDGVRSALFPALGAIIAGDVTETGNYPQQQPSFMEHMLELKVQKAGIELQMGEDVLEDAQWDLFGIYVTMASAAMDRWKEEKIFNEAMERAFVVFDNTITTDPDYLTGGQDTSGHLNGSVAFTDLMDLVGGVLSNGYTPTDIALHPLAWVMLAKDPRLLFHLLNNGNYQQTVPMPGLDAASIQKNLPFGSINVTVTPQMDFDYKKSISIEGVGTLDPCHMGSILALDRQSALVVLQRSDKEMDEFKFQERDIHCLRASERYAVGALDEGRGLAIMKNLRFVQNHQSIFNVGMGTVS